MTKGVKIVVSLLVALVLILLVVVFLLWQRNKLNQSKESILDKPVITVSPVQVATTPTVAVPEATTEMLAGGDVDEHGCKASAGYSWCEVKKKCLRNWEEPCDMDSKTAVQKLLAKAHNRSESEVTIKITKEDADHVAGSVMFGAGGPGEGGMFLAVKQNGVWQVVFEGIGAVDCQKMRSVYGFSNEILKPNFCD